MSNNEHPIWTDLNSDSDIPDIGYCEVPSLNDLEAYTLDKDSIVLVHNNNDWQLYTYTHATNDLQLVDPEDLKLQILQFTRRIGEHLAGLASYAEIIGAIHYNQSGIRKFCDKSFTFQRMMKDLDWWEEFYPKVQEREVEDSGLLTYEQLPEGVQINSISVETEQDKQQLLLALKYLHDRDIDTDLVAVNELVHMYHAPHRILTNKSDNGVLTLGAGSTFKYQGIEYTLVQVPNDGAWQWMTKEGKYALCQGFYTTFPPTVEQVFAMAKHLP